MNKKKPNSQATETKLERDLATFERLPEKTKKLMKLKDKDEKATGSEQVETTRRIQEKDRESRP